MINFCKNTNCPSSQSLLAFQSGESSNEENENIRVHLTSCEFCTAEVEFYARFPQAEDACIESKIPAPLLQLAEALLSNQKKKFTMLNDMLSEAESLTLKKV